MTGIRKSQKFRSLAVTLAITFSILIIIVLLIASILQMYFSFQTHHKILDTNQELIAQNAANKVEGFIREKFSILGAVARRSKLANMIQERQKPVLERLLGIEPIFRQLILLDAKEKELIRVSRISKMLAVTSMEYNKEELLSQVYHYEIYVSAIYIDKITSEPMVIMAVPITNILGDYKGALVAEANLKFMWELMDQIRIGKNGHVYVVDNQGFLIAFRDISRVLRRENLNYLEEVRECINRNESVVESGSEISKGILNTYVSTTHVRLKIPKWSVIVELPLMEAYRTIIIMFILSGLVMLVSIFLAIISGIFLAKRVTRPIIELRDATKKIGKGKLNLKIRINSNNEVGDLAKSFKKMVEDLNNTTVSRNALEKEVNERRQVEKILRDSEQKMKAILMASPIGIGLINDRKLDWANETFYRMVGYEEDSVLGKSISILYLNDKEYERVNRKLFHSITGPRIRHIETRWIRKDGRIFDCILGSCTLDPANPLKGHIITVSDISESKRLQSKLLHAQKMEAIGTLAAGVAHDLNNILVSLVGYPELLLMNISEDDPLRKPLLTILKSGERAATIVQDLLTLARRGVAISEIVCLNDVISDYLKSPEYENLCSFHQNIKLVTTLDPNLLYILGSPFHLSKVIMNLASNAAESMIDGGEIVISTQNRYLDIPLTGYEHIKEGDYVTLTISDNGEGISKEDMKKIFEPFYTKKKMGRSGTGLGMSVVWGTVKDHHGYINIQSTKGKGTSFTLFFPISRKEITEGKSLFTDKNYLARGETILVIDDIEEQRLIVSEILKKLGYEVTTVASGEEGVDYLKNNATDLVVLDMIMDPGIDGLETYKRIIKMYPHQKAIITSGFSETEQVKQAQRLGAGAYIKKPYSFEKIGRAVRDALDK